jgi:anti-sigma regulatory factor (Ser/Thr protein kinase)
MADDGVRHRLLPPVVASVSVARAFVTTVARRWGADGVAADLALVVSELVTNAIEHGTGPVDVAARRCGTGIEVEVTSGLTAERPERLAPPPVRPSGRGLLVVDALAADWGHRQVAQRLTVWARLLP